jgi:hypothetical protein
VFTIPYTSGGYVKAPLTKWESTVADPTTLPVEVAIITPGADPVNGDYIAATWVTENGTVKVRVLWKTAVPSAAPGRTYAMWLRLTVSGELVVIYSGPIKTL